MKSMRLTIIILLLIITNLYAQENEYNYRFSELITPSICGTYLLEDDITNSKNYHTINWRMNINNKETHNYTTYYCINTGKQTVWGISSDDFAITKEEFKKLNTTNIQKGFFYDTSNRKFIKISNNTGAIHDDSVKQSIKMFLWKQIINGVVIKQDSGITVTESGVVYNGEIYEIELASIWETSPSKRNNFV